MKQIYEDLYETQLALAFGTIKTHAYFLKLPSHNVLFYNTHIKEDIEQMKHLGGIKFQYLSHRHEAANSLNTLKKEFQHQLCAHNNEADAISEFSKPDYLFNQDEIHQNIQVIDTSGHTQGCCCYLYHSSITHKNYLFTGDTLYFDNEELNILIIEKHGGSKEQLKKNLEKLKNIAPDVVLCSGYIGENSFKEFTQEQWINSLEKNIQKLS